MLSSHFLVAEIPVEIAEGFKQSQLLEGGGIAIKGVDESAFVNYIMKNWPTLTDDLKALPVADGSFDSPKMAHDASVAILGAACESLSPVDYVKFLEKWVGLFESGEVPFQAIQNSMFGITDRKLYFVAVNWQDPKIQSILKRVIAHAPPEKTEDLEAFEMMAKGKLADSYMTNRSEFSTLPQTLPGIRLMPPESGMMARMKSAVTGEPSEGRSRVISASLDAPGSVATVNSSGTTWLILAAISLLLAGVGMVLKVKFKKSV